MAVSRQSFHSTPSPDRAIPKSIACLEDTIRTIAAGEASVLIIGERGTRKEVIARAVHALSPRAAGPFVSVSRPELTEEFIERALFGEGPAPGQGGGRLAKAEGGALFLDEVCDFPIATQARLAEALGAARPQSAGGGNTTARLIASSVREPEESIQSRTLHPELHELLRVFIVRVPPLRERKGEILDLVHDCVSGLAAAHGGSVPRLSSAAISRLIAYPWPGNVHELEQCIAHAFVMANGANIEERHLPSAVGGQGDGGDSDRASEDNLQATIDSVERALIEEALRASHGNQAKAAQNLGITERLMGLRVRKYGIESRHFRHGGQE